MVCNLCFSLRLLPALLWYRRMDAAGIMPRRSALHMLWHSRVARSAQRCLSSLAMPCGIIVSAIALFSCRLPRGVRTDGTCRSSVLHVPFVRTAGGIRQLKGICWKVGSVV